MSSDPKSNKVRLRSNSIFAFLNDDVYSNLGNDDQQVQEEKIIINNSNFFSKSEDEISCGVYLNFGKKENKSSNSCSVSSDLEKNFDFLKEEDSKDKLDMAKLDLTQDSQSSLSKSEKSESQHSEHYDAVDLNMLNKKTENFNKRFSADNTNTPGNLNNMKVLIHSKLNNLNDIEQNKSFDSVSPVSCYSYSPVKSGLLRNANNHFQFTNIPSNMSNHSMNLNSETVSPILINRNIPNLNDGFNLNLNSLNSHEQNFHFKNTNLNSSNYQSNTPSHSPYLVNKANTNHNYPLSMNSSFNKNYNMVNKNQSVNSPVYVKSNNTSLNNFSQYANMFTKHSSKDSNNNSFKKNKEVKVTHFKNQPYRMNSNTSAKSLQEAIQDDNYVLENINSLLSDQNGCRMVQKKIEERKEDSQFISSLFVSLETNLIDYINDQFGNYVIQKYFECVYNDLNSVNTFFEKIRNCLIIICINPYGTRFFQKALEFITPNYAQIETENLNFILKELIQKHTMDLILDTNGNHVFQKILTLYPKKLNNFIYDELVRSAFSISKLKQGGCIFQRAFDMSNREQRKVLVFEILKYTQILINDEYGNFIIQQIVLLKDPEFNEIILKFLKTNFGVLAKKKFSSNVIDKEIKSAVKVLKQTSYGRKIYESLIMQYGDYFQNTNFKLNNNERRNSVMNNFGTFNRLDDY